MTHLPMFAAGFGVVTAGGALWLQGSHRMDRRLFAGLVAAAVTFSLCSFIAWAATSIGRIGSLPVIWALVAALAVIFALRLYRELRMPQRRDRRKRLSE